MQNGFVESINGRMRDELLNETMFRNLAHARVVIAAWAADYYTERPLPAQTGPAVSDRDSAARPVEAAIRCACRTPATVGGQLCGTFQTFATLAPMSGLTNRSTNGSF